MMKVTRLDKNLVTFFECFPNIDVRNSSIEEKGY